MSLTLVRLTPPRLAALRMVAEGKIERVYRAGGNSIRKMPGMNATAVWWLIREKMIEDGPDKVMGVFSASCKMVLTDRGARVLEEHA